jgi:hypothetical protein
VEGVSDAAVAAAAAATCAAGMLLELLLLLPHGFRHDESVTWHAISRWLWCGVTVGATYCFCCCADCVPQFVQNAMQAAA